MFAALTHPAPMLPGESRAGYRAISGAERARRCDEAFAAERAAPFPLAWLSRLLGKWRERWRVDHAAANLAHLQRCRALHDARAAGLDADANDSGIVQRATDAAREVVRRCGVVAGEWSAHPLLVRLMHMREWMARWNLGDVWMALRRKHDGAASLARAQCERWWRLVLRRLHARAVESTARALGLVHKRAGCYVSHDALNRRTGQLVRNERTLQSVVAVNDLGQDMTLAELAARGPANKEIRRQELMTRIAGFELIARQCGHEALFVTVTCPSRMHAYRTAGAGVEANPKHDGTTPDDAQAYLVKQWAAFRSACERWGVELYGFRIAEPNHDGTPHWHALLFMPAVVAPGTVKVNPRAGRPVALRVAARLLRRYFLRNTDAAERGARAHRVKVERIDWNRGSAAGYVAKYVAKNIDGYRVERDLYGNDSITSSRRVDAWAATWRIRQFQQIGGAPVTVWRELRRLHPEQAASSPTVADFLGAINKGAALRECVTDEAKRYTAATAWAEFTELQGGYRVRRAALRVRLLKEQTGEVGRYGEPLAARALGIATDEVRREWVSMPLMNDRGGYFHSMRLRAEVESERCEWIVVGVASDSKDARSRAVQRVRDRVSARGEAARPWSPVNNCTRLDFDPPSRFAPRIERTKKTGRFHAWATGAADPPSAEEGEFQ